MQIRRPGAKGYEEVDGVNLPSPTSETASIHGGSLSSNHTHMAPEFELASVSVVPDGKKFIFLLLPLVL
jgi:hypothetical protein